MTRWIACQAPTLTCVGAAGAPRSIAGKIALSRRLPHAELQQRAAVRVDGDIAGRVHGMGSWRDASTFECLVEALDAPLRAALRQDFEWYRCRGAFFHNDAHYDARLFGVWCIATPPADLVFPRVEVRVALESGTIVLFDPFEVHGVLAPARSTYAAGDYQDAEASVFLGFEVNITEEVAQLFGIGAGTGLTISSRTRINAATGALS